MKLVRKISLFVIFAILVMLWHAPFGYTREKHYLIQPLTEFSFRQAFWSLLFNDIWPRAQYAVVLSNMEPQNGKNITNGIIILQVAKDKGLAKEPSEEEFSFLSYVVFDAISPGERAEFVFTLSNQYKPERYRIKPRIFIYPEGASPIGYLAKEMKKHGSSVLNTWERVYFSDWRKKLEEIPGVITIEQPSYLIVTRDFYVILSSTGVSLLGIFLGIWGIAKRLKRSKRSKKNIPAETKIATDKPSFEVSLDNKNLSKSSVLTIGIWVKNLSTRAHNIVDIKGEHEGHPNNFKISIVDRKYRLPVQLSPAEPEKIIVFMGQFLSGDPTSECNIIIRVFSRWEGKEIEAGNIKISLN